MHLPFELARAELNDAFSSLSLAESYKVHYLEALQAIPLDMRKHLDLALSEREFSQNVRCL